MKVWEYEGFTHQEAWRTRRAWCLEELQPYDDPMTLMVDLAPGAEQLSDGDFEQLRLFAGYMRLRAEHDPTPQREDSDDHRG